MHRPRAIDTRARAARPGAILLLLALWPAVPACSVPQPARPRFEAVDSTTLPNLRRSQEALQDLLAREREHVGALNLQISELRTEEGRLNEVYLQNEHDYLLLEDDLAGVQEEILGVKADIQAARDELKKAKAQLKTLQAELVEVQAQRVEMEAAIAALRRLVERGRVALAALPPETRALIQAELSAAAARATEGAPEGASEGAADGSTESNQAPSPEPATGPAGGEGGGSGDG